MVSQSLAVVTLAACLATGSQAKKTCRIKTSHASATLSTNSVVQPTDSVSSTGSVDTVQSSLSSTTNAVTGTLTSDSSSLPTTGTASSDIVIVTTTTTTNASPTTTGTTTTISSSSVSSSDSTSSTIALASTTSTTTGASDTTTAATSTSASSSDSTSSATTSTSSTPTTTTASSNAAVSSTDTASSATSSTSTAPTTTTTSAGPSSTNTCDTSTATFNLNELAVLGLLTQDELDEYLKALGLIPQAKKRRHENLEQRATADQSVFYQPICGKTFKNGGQAETAHAQDVNYCLALCNARAGLLTVSAGVKAGDHAHIQVCASAAFDPSVTNGNNCRYLVRPETSPVSESDLVDSPAANVYIRN